MFSRLKKCLFARAAEVGENGGGNKGPQHFAEGLGKDPWSSSDLN